MKKKGCDIVIKSVNKLKNKFRNKILFIGPMTGSSYEVYIKNLVKNIIYKKKFYFPTHFTVTQNGDQFQHLEEWCLLLMVRTLVFQ